ncbi:hypothetical protein PISMIDRAFT_680796 [Pisolithus microcarpus 441]|uniref:Uncharacterized protein n=1 Tax=Pisolithus microcarpus 441 TaxID=765257 RepID=A0A0C9YZ67_9AGAM|nr:hypothetical protein PISMIDRAFT_680796 [Pisolithus microcarpus 441]
MGYSAVRILPIKAEANACLRLHLRAITSLKKRFCTRSRCRRAETTSSIHNFYLQDSTTTV